MAKTTVVEPDYDLQEAGGSIAARFDALPWNEFEHHEKQRRDALKTEIFVIRRDLMKLGAHDMPMAARIWDEHVPTFVPRPDFREPDPIFVNTIEPGRRKRRVSPEPWLEAQTDADRRVEARAPSTPETPRTQATEPETDPRARRHRLLRDGLAKQYLMAEDKYHFRDRTGEVAFEAQDKRLITSHETPGIVSSMVDLAEARGWETLKLSGTESFRREAWLQAGLRGLDVTGFRPTKLDTVRLEDMRSEFGPDRDRRNTISHDREPQKLSDHPEYTPIDESDRSEGRPALSEGQDAVLAALTKAMRARGDSEQAVAAATEFAAQKLGKGRVHVGKLTEMGMAPYQDRAGEVQSHYVMLEDEAGRRQKIWGADLPRALDEAHVSKGEHITLAFRGQKAVTVTVKVPSEDGKGVRLEKREVERNAWEAVKLDRLRDSVRDRVEKQAAGVVRSTASTKRPTERSGSKQSRKERYR